jgi:ribosomal protein L11 methyltransferase
MESLSETKKGFLDIGTGTGILSVIASKLGIPKVVGFDNDRPSALVAGKNFRVNGCEGGTFFCAQLKSLKLTERFEMVGANLLSKTLLEHRARILSRVSPGGSLLISGVSLQNFPAFRRGFDGPGVRCLKILRGRRWIAALYKKGPAVN